MPGGTMFKKSKNNPVFFHEIGSIKKAGENKWKKTEKWRPVW